MNAMSHSSTEATAPAGHEEAEQVSRGTLAGMTLLSFLLFAGGLGITAYLGGFR